MKRILIACTLLFIASNANAQIQFTQPNVVSAAQAQGFTYTIYQTAPGSTTSVSFILIGVTCTFQGGTASCSTPVPSSINTSTGMRFELTAKDGTSAESAKSIPFSLPADVPMGLRIIR